jgi:hypothetical protein
MIASWLLVVAWVAISGWPYSDVTSSVISLIPGLLLVLLWVGASLYVARHFRQSPPA